MWKETRFKGTTLYKTEVIIFGETDPLSIEIEGKKLEDVFYGVHEIT